MYVFQLLANLDRLGGVSEAPPKRIIQAQIGSWTRDGWCDFIKPRVHEPDLGLLVKVRINHVGVGSLDRDFEVHGRNGGEEPVLPGDTNVPSDNLCQASLKRLLVFVSDGIKLLAGENMVVRTKRVLNFVVLCDYSSH